MSPTRTTGSSAELQRGDARRARSGRDREAIIDANLYMVLGTADEGGRPWVSSVYYAPVAYREFIWVSRPEARRPRVEAR